MSSFERNVFVNCPFDSDYRDLLLSIVFTIKYLGFEPRLALERSDSGESRIKKILDLIKNSKYGIHDISRMKAKSRGEHSRMNMPFELGIDYGCQHLGSPKLKTKKILVLEEQKYSYQKALSDLSGSDIKDHDNQPLAAIKAVRNWFIPDELEQGASHTVIFEKYMFFQSYLFDELVVKHGHETIEGIQVSEIITCMSRWFSENPVA